MPFFLIPLLGGLGAGYYYGSDQKTPQQELMSTVKIVVIAVAVIIALRYIYKK